MTKRLADMTPEELARDRAGLAARSAKAKAAYAANPKPNRDRMREYARRNPEANRDRAREWNDRHRSTRPDRARRSLYGITPEAFRAMFDAQGGLCAICRLRAADHVDHCHTFGHVRALLCRKCNLGLGHFHDRPDLFRAAADYLERHTPGESPAPEPPLTLEPSAAPEK